MISVEYYIHSKYILLSFLELDCQTANSISFIHFLHTYNLHKNYKQNTMALFEQGNLSQPYNVAYVVPDSN